MRDFNIATTATYAYFPFLLSFLGSLHYQYKSGFPGKIIVGVDNLPFNLEKSLLHYKNVNLETISQDIEPFSGVHGQAWMKAVSSKLSMVSEIIRKDRTPLLLIDSDILFTQSVHELFDTNFDVVVTYISETSERHTRRDGLTVDYIGSAAFFNNPEKSLLFIDEWMRLMGQLKGTTYPPYETPALNLLLKSEFLKNQAISVGVMQDRVIACDQALKDDTRAIHLKSWGPSKDDPVLNYRVRCARGDFNKQFFPPVHNDYLLYEDWVTSQLFSRSTSYSELTTTDDNRERLNYAPSSETTLHANEFASSKRARVVFANGGLANRLQAILFPLALTPGDGKFPTIWWPKNEWCDCEFDYLFESSLKVRDTDLTKEVQRKEAENSGGKKNPKSALILTHLTTPFKDLANEISQDKIKSLSELRELWLHYDGSLIYNHNSFPCYWDQQNDLDFLVPALKMLSPKKSIREKANKFIADHNISHSTNGLHIRGTDFKPEQHQLEKIYSFVVSSPGDRFFLCTDDREIKNTFSGLRNVVTVAHDSFVSFDVATNKIHRSDDSMVAAMIDLLILSHTRILVTSKSSYLNFASILSRINFSSGSHVWL